MYRNELQFSREAGDFCFSSCWSLPQSPVIPMKSNLALAISPYMPLYLLSYLRGLQTVHPNTTIRSALQFLTCSLRSISILSVLAPFGPSRTAQSSSTILMYILKRFGHSIVDVDMRAACQIAILATSRS